MHRFVLCVLMYAVNAGYLIWASLVYSLFKIRKSWSLCDHIRSQFVSPVEPGNTLLRESETSPQESTLYVDGLFSNDHLAPTTRDHSSLPPLEAHP